MAGDQLSNPLVDFEAYTARLPEGWGSTLKPPGRLRALSCLQPLLLGINSQTPW